MAEPFAGYTLFSPNNSRYTYLADMNNSITHTWNHTTNGGYSVYLLENGRILRSAEANNPDIGGGGAAGKVQEIDWSGNLVWNYTYSSSTYLSHHDIEPLPNGNVLLIAWEVKTASQARQAGYSSYVELWPDHIVEIQPVGSTGGNIVWAWHAWDHLIQDYDASKDNYGDVGDHPELLDINMSGGAGPSGGDWMHLNGISYNPDLDQIVCSSHTLDELYVIDHSTTTEEAAGHTGGNSGMGGDILYRWGNPSNYDAPGSAYFNVVHSSVWIPAGLPGAGHIMAFNNREGQGTSIVAEIAPPVDSEGHYHIGQDSAFGPSAPIWTYTASGFYSNHLGGCQRLPNGNTLIVESTSGYMFEVNSAGVTQWSYARGGEISRALRYGPNLQSPWATVSSPNGAEIWDVGNSHDITWSAGDYYGVDAYKLEYSTNGGTSWLTIQDWVDGSPLTYSWIIPNTASSSCKVKVSCRDAAGNIGSDSSNANFTIRLSDTEAPAVAVSSPNGGESWEVASAQSITWTDNDNVGIISHKLDYSTDSGVSWISILDWTSGDPHLFVWTIPNMPSTQCRVRVSGRDASSNTGSDQSNADFTIRITAPGTIEGYVFDQGNTSPLDAVIIDTYNSSNIVVAVDTSDINGFYQLELSAGVYHEHFSKIGYASADFAGITVQSDSISIVSVALSPAGGNCDYLPGDINGNGSANGIDVTYGVSYFKGGSAPPDNCAVPDGPCALSNPFYASADVNGNCQFNGIDITFFVGFLKGMQPSILYCPGCPPLLALLASPGIPAAEINLDKDE